MLTKKEAWQSSFIVVVVVAVVAVVAVRPISDGAPLPKERY